MRAPAPASPGEGVANEWTSRSVAEMRCRRDPADERGGRQSPSPLAEEEEAVSRCDKETNTECVFLPEGRRGRKGVAGDPAAALHGPPAPQVPVKRSQTFGPVGHRYVCRVRWLSSILTLSRSLSLSLTHTLILSIVLTHTLLQ